MELGGLEVDIDEEVIDKYTRNGQSIGFNGFNSGRSRSVSGRVSVLSPGN